MKHNFLLLTLTAFTFLACQKEQPTELQPQQSLPKKPGMQQFMRYGTGRHSQPIAIDTANLMIQSYFESINYPEDNTQLRSLSFDADSLRMYLSDNNIATVKFMLAHPLSYIHSGNYGVYGGTTAGSLTLVIVGMDKHDNYVYRNSCVYDHALPCPTNCDNAPVLLQ